MLSPALLCGAGIVLAIAGTARAITGRAARGIDTAPLGVAWLAAFVVIDTQVAALAGFQRGWVAALVIAAVATGATWCMRPPRAAADVRIPAGSRRLWWLTALALAGPLAWLPVPLDTDAQGFGYLALTVRDGGSLFTLSPWQPSIAYVYAPGMLVGLARVSSLVPALSMSDVMLGAGHAASWLFVWVAGACGHELGMSLEAARGGARERAQPESGWHTSATIAAAASAGMWTALLDAHYTSVLALVFMVGWLAWSLRAWRTGDVRAFAASAVTLAALAATHQDTAIIAGLGAVPLAVCAWATARRDLRPRVAVFLLATPVVVAMLLAPWLLHLRQQLAGGVASPFERSLSHWRQLVLYHGGVWPVLALVALAVRTTSAWTWALAAWLVLIADASMFGALERVVPGLAAPMARFDYPFSLAWHGPIAPYLLLGTIALAWVAARFGLALHAWPGRRLAAALAVAGVVAIPAMPWLARAAGRVVGWHGAFASDNDVRALRWIGRELPRGARVLNYPGDYEHQRDWEGHWAPVVAARDAVYFRMQPFFLDGPALAAARAEQRMFLGFWRDPVHPSHAAALRAGGIDAVVVPEILNDAGATSWRGQPPALLDGAVSHPRDAAYLRLAFQAGGAEVYVPREAPP